MEVSALGFGAAEIGFENTDDHTVDALIGSAQDAGLNVIDTAAMYGESEEKIGRALHSRRDQFLIFTKCGRHLPSRSNPLRFVACAQQNLRRLRGRAGEYESSDWHSRVLRSNIENSLRRLKTDCVDLIQLHSCSEESLRRGEVIEVLQRARESGKARHIGYSGDGTAALYAIECGQFEALEISINVADQEALDVVVPLARHRGVGVIAKRPIANAVWKSIKRPTAAHLQAYWDRLQELRFDFLQAGDGLETALQFDLAAPMHTMIVGTTNPAHLRQNAQSAEVGALDDAQFAAIRAHWKAVAKENWVGQM